MTPAQVAAAQASAGRMVRVYEDQSALAQRRTDWAPRFTLLVLPIFSVLLALSYAGQRERHL